MFINKKDIKEHFKYGVNEWTGEPNKPVFYNEEMRKAVHRVKKPPMLLMDVVMYPEFLALRLYEDNFLQFEGTKKEMVIDYVGKVKRLLESYGVRCELEGKPSGRIL
ncbi:MAG: hypothetical protein O3A64_03320 [Proteobacteria bacterium]|nr:hypothetical protein [Pseudomonadota bacterium]